MNLSGFEAWAVRSLAAGGVVLLAGYLLACLCRATAGRQAAVAWAVRGAVLAAVVAAFPGWLPVTLPAPSPGPTVTVAAEPPTELMIWEYVGSPESADELIEVSPVADATHVEPPVVSVTESSPSQWLVVGYVGLVATFVFRLVIGQLGLIRLTRQASPAPQRVRARFPGRVLVADRVRSPVCFGLFQPTVLLPRGLAETASASELDWVLAHEADHLRRGDHRSAWWAAVAGCLFFPLPWYWAVRRELVLAQEFLADAAAAGDRPADYAAYLVHLSAAPARLPQLAAGVRPGRSDLSRRVTMLLNDGPKPRRATRLWRSVVGSGAVAGAVALGGLTVRTANADEPKPAKVVEVEVRLDDEKKPDDVKKPDGDKRKLEAKRGTLVLQAKTPPDVARLKEQIKAAAKKGNVDEVAELVEKLEKVLRSMPRVFTVEGREIKGQGSGTLRLMPGTELPAMPREFRFEGPGIDEAIRQIQRQLDNLKEAAPEHRRALEQALESLRGQQRQFGQWRMATGGPDVFVGQRPRFGVGVAAVPAEMRDQADLAESIGVLADQVQDGSTAEKAGLKKGDIIVRFAGKEVGSDPGRFAELVQGARPGKVELVVIRKGKKQNLSAELPPAARSPERPSGPQAEEGAVRRRAEEARRQAEEARRLVEEVRRHADENRRRDESRREEGRRGGADREGRRNESRSVSISINNDKFTVQATGSGPDFNVSGTIEDGKPQVESVTVKDRDETFKGKSLSDVPERYRDQIRKLLAGVSGKR